jgi:hypothetical protein
MKRLSMMLIAIVALGMSTSCKDDKKEANSEMNEEMPM